jgi:DcmR-like sensory protein
MTVKESQLVASVLNGKHRHHLCAFFHDKEEEFRTLLPFVVDGLAAGEKAVHVVHPKNREAHRHRLSNAGIDVEAAEQRGQLDVVAGPSGYINGDTFDQSGALKIIDDLLNEARLMGFRQTRYIGFMDWAAEIRGEELIAFEALACPVLAKHDDPVICSYDLSRFNGADVLDIMRTHPAAIIAGVLQENPFNVSPEQMMRELRERAEGEVPIAAGQRDPRA